MKKRLLSFFAFALTALMVNAQSWAKPEIKLTTDQVPEKAYIYNVESNKFLTKGGAWGNHASVKSDASVAFLYEMQAQGEENTYKLHCSAAANNGMLGRQSIEDVYTDWKAQADWGLTWEFISTEGGFIVRTAASDPQYGANKYTDDDPVNYGLYILGYNPERDDLTNGSGDPMGTHDGIYMVDPTNADGYGCTWVFMTEDDYAVYSVQMSLYNKLEEALEVGFTEAELNSYAALLNSTDVEAIKAAIAEVDGKILNYAYDHATPENPFDVTAKIVNPTFEGAKGAVAAGWTDVFGNMLIQNNKAYHIWDDDLGAESDQYGFQNFVQNWTSSNDVSCGASHIYQTLTELPQGTYILQADAIATSASASLVISGAELYATSGAARYAMALDKNAYGAEGSSLPHRYELFVTHMGGDLTIGLELSADGYAKWFGADNFKLFYAGPVDNPGLVALTSAIAAAEPYVDEYAEEDKYYYSEETKDELEKLLDASEGLTESEACLTAAGKINDMLKTVKAEVAAYGNLAKFVQQVGGDLSKYPFIDDLGDKYDDYKGAYEDKKATVEQINEWISAYPDYIVNGIKAAMPSATEENPIEVTGLFKNLGFEENTTESATPTNWESNASAFKARANVAEVWNVAFDAHTTLEGLPAGAYRITAHALSRSGSSVENYNAFLETGMSPVSSEMYANNSVVKVQSQHVGATEEQLYTNDVNLTDDETNPLWAPNSMEGARAYFNVEATPYVAEVTANLVNDNDPLVIGFRDNGVDGTVAGNSWTIWSDVRVYYIGVSKNELYNEMVAIAQSTYDMEDNCLVVKGCDTLSDARNAADKLSSSSSEEEITNAINNLADAIKYYNDGKALVNEVINLSTSGVYDEVINNYSVTGGSELSKILDEMNDAIADEEFESNEQIEGWLKSLPGARTAHIFAAVVTEQGLTPSEEEPADVTDVMVNPKFDQGTNNKSGATGWTFDWKADHIGWNNETQQSGSDYAYEYWKATVFDMNQTIVGLPEGFYRVSCQALYRPGNNTDEVAAIYAADPDNARDMAFYANSNSVRVTSVYDYAQAEAAGVDGEGSCTLNGETVYIPNTMISAAGYFQLGFYTNTIIVKVEKDEDLKIGLKLDGNVVDANWCVFDNFKIEALGKTAPTAIEGVEADAIMAGKVAIFSINGQQQSRLQKGVNIVRKADGKVVKLLVK